MGATNRQGQRWSRDEINDLVSQVRAGVDRTVIAASLGRTTGGVSAAAHRLISPDRRPSTRNESWQMLRRDLAATDPRGDPDWWLLFTGLHEQPIQRSPKKVPQANQGASGLGGAIAPATSAAHQLDTASAGDGWCELFINAVEELTNERLRYVLLRRGGLLGGRSTLQEIGDEWELSRERIRQLEEKALVRIESRARRSDTAAGAIAAAISMLADDDHSLVMRLTEIASTEFDCQAAWLVKAIARMGGHSHDDAERLGTLTGQYLAYRRKQARTQLRDRRHLAAVERCLSKWIKATAWPDPTRSHVRESPQVGRQRSKNDPGGVGQSGSFHSEKLGTTVIFDSQLEEAALEIAERSTRVRSYQEQPCKIAYIDACGERRVYIPDLLMSLTDGRTILIEVKPLFQMAVTENRVKSEAGQRFAFQHGWGWVTVADVGRTYTDLLARDIAPAARCALTQALAAGPVTWDDIRRLRKQTPISTLDIAAYAAQNNVALSLTPYHLGGI